MTTSTAMDTASVAVWVDVGMAFRVLTNFSTVPPLPASTPNMPATWPIATWMPTPVRKPMRTLRDRKLAMKPRFNSRAPMRRTAHRRAESPARATYSGEPATAPVATMPVAMIAAVAESAPTTRWRDEPNRANTATGRRIV